MFTTQKQVNANLNYKSFSMVFGAPGCTLQRFSGAGTPSRPTLPMANFLFTPCICMTARPARAKKIKSRAA